MKTPGSLSSGINRLDAGWVAGIARRLLKRTMNLLLSLNWGQRSGQATAKLGAVGKAAMCRNSRANIFMRDVDADCRIQDT
jgi:hypothetical protein